MTPNWTLTIIFLAIVAVCLHVRFARGENTLREPYGRCDQQTLDEALPLERAGDREALRSHLRSRGADFEVPAIPARGRDPGRERPIGEPR